MTATNDMVDLSRSNAKSQIKADSSDLAAQSVGMVANPQIYKRFYRGGDDSIAYETVEEISQWLVARPHGVEDYQVTILGLATQFSRWSDFRGMRQELSFLVDVRIRVAELRGDRHLA